MTLLVIKTLYSAHTDSDSAGQDRIPSKYKHTFNQIPYNWNQIDVFYSLLESFWKIVLVDIILNFMLKK